MTIGEPWRREEDGAWMVPTRAEDEENKTVGFGWAELTEDHPMYKEWAKYLSETVGSSWAQRISDQIG